MVDAAVKSGHKYYANKALPSWLGKLRYKQMTNNFFNYSDRTTREVIMEIFNDEKIISLELS